MIDPAPVRVPVLLANGRPSPEWEKWFAQVRLASGTVPKATTQAIAQNSTTLQTVVTQLAAISPPLLIETNSFPNGSQSVLNLISGPNVSLSQDGLGNVTISSTGGGGSSSGGGGATIALETNGTVNGSQSILNLVPGTNISISDSGTGNITIAGPAVPTELTETPIGAINGSNTTFTLSFAPNPASSLTVWLNGVEQVPGTDIALSGNTIFYSVAPSAPDQHVAEYTH